MSLIRHRQRVVTALFPHNGNRRYLVPKRGGVVENFTLPPPGLLGDEAYFLSACGVFFTCANEMTITPAPAPGPSVAGAGTAAGAWTVGPAPNLLRNGVLTVAVDATALAYAGPGTGSWSFFFGGVGSPLVPASAVGNFYYFFVPALEVISAQIRITGFAGVGTTNHRFFDAYTGDQRAAFAAAGYVDITP
jgi:hypothetical protein